MCDMCFGIVGRKWQTLASLAVYLAVIADFLALDDDEHTSECALIHVTDAWYHFTLHVFLFVIRYSFRHSIK